MADPDDTSDMIRRISVLEASLGLSGSLEEVSTDSPSVKLSLPADFNSRIEALHHELQTRVSSQDTLHFSLQTELSNCENLAKNLDPSGLMLACSNNPSDVSESAFIFRRQELLARCEDLHYGFQTLAEIRDLLLRSYPQLTKAIQERQQNLSPSPSSYASNIEQLILTAPIISSSAFEFSSDPIHADRLETVTTNIMELYERASNLIQKADDLIERYYSIMAVVNEKLGLLMDENAEKPKHSAR